MANNPDKIDYSVITSKYPWIIAKNQKAILSPDSDGLLCGLLMSHFLDWEVVGFYDGKVLFLQKDLTAQDCIFLDVDIFRKEIKSIGHHMVMYRKDQLHPKWNYYDNCIQPNNIRNYDFLNDFKLKYPLATIHLLLGILGTQFPNDIEIKKESICLLLYTDGTFKNLFNYPENCLSWLKFLGADEKESLLNLIFFNDHYSISDLMMALRDFFEQIAKINSGKRGGDKISLSDSKGKIKDFVKNGNVYSILPEKKAITDSFINLLSSLTGWQYKREHWIWNELKLYKFSKSLIKPTLGRYIKLLNKKPLSLAITSQAGIEYTLERPDKLL